MPRKTYPYQVVYEDLSNGEQPGQGSRRAEDFDATTAEDAITQFHRRAAEVGWDLALVPILEVYRI